MPIRLQLLLFGVLGNVLVAAIFIFSFDYRENIQEDSSNESLLTLYESAWYQTYNKSFDVMSKWLPVTGENASYWEEDSEIFLDEVAELPIGTQARLLRVLETGEYLRVGSSKVQKTNVRIVAATNVNVYEAVQRGKFREDLYYRLNTVPIFLPPLRDRKEDIHLLFRKFASDFAKKYNRVVGVDAASIHLNKAKERLPEVEFHESLIEDFDTVEKFDNVFLS